RNRWWQKLLQPEIGLSEKWGGLTGRFDPSTWLAERMIPGRRALWMLLLSAAGICFLAGWLGGTSAIGFFIAIQLFSGFLMKLWIVIIAVQPLNTARRSGALELILCTPLDEGTLIRGQVNALLASFTGPSVFVSFGF